jgi:hypothetical protein
MLLELPAARLHSLGAIDSDAGHSSGLILDFLRLDRQSCVYCVSRLFVGEHPAITLQFAQGDLP